MTLPDTQLPIRVAKSLAINFWKKEASQTLLPEASWLYQNNKIYLICFLNSLERNQKLPHLPYY